MRRRAQARLTRQCGCTALPRACGRKTPENRPLKRQVSRLPFDRCDCELEWIPHSREERAMTTRAIQNQPEQPAMNEDQVVSAEPSPTNLGGRPGRWSTRHRKIIIVLLLAAFVLVGAFLASRPGASDATAAGGASTGAPDFAAIDKFVETEMDAQRIPGLALGIVEDD